MPSGVFYLGVGAFSAGRWAETAASVAESLRLAEEAGLRVDALAARAGLARLEARRGSPLAAEHASAVLAAAPDLATPFFQAWTHHAEGELAWVRGDLPAAVAAFERKQRVLDDARIDDADLSPAPELAEAYVALGRHAEAREQAQRATADAEAKGRPWALARARRAEALVC